METNRKQAEQNYKAAFAIFDEASSGDDLGAYFAAKDELETARNSLILAEEKYPTKAEMNRASRKTWQRSIGLDA